MTGKTLRWRDRFANAYCSREALSGHPWLQSVAGRLRDPRLWRLQHEALARGVAVGTFWAFVLPFGQIPVAVVHCIWWRANLPAAAAMTMLTNPLTIGFWLWLAYQLGALLLGQSRDPTMPAPEGVSAWLLAYGRPATLGMALFAVGGATLGYLGVKLVWRLRMVLRRAMRRA
jgi:uncharacterized protein (DUF2062 family)